MRKLEFSPLAYLKLQYLCHAGDTEIGGFGISSVDAPFYVDDIAIVEQDSGIAHCEFTENGIADHVERYSEAGYSADEYFRIWIHTHPGASVSPSGTDENTFRDVFSKAPWAIMAILGRTGKLSARLRCPPGITVELEHRVRWEDWPTGLEYDEWVQEYETLIHRAKPVALAHRQEVIESDAGLKEWDEWCAKAPDAELKEGFHGVY